MARLFTLCNQRGRCFSLFNQDYSSRSSSGHLLILFDRFRLSAMRNRNVVSQFERVKTL